MGDGLGQLQLIVAALCDDLRVPAPIREYQGIPGRRFAFDFAWPEQRVALEYEGGVFGQNRPGRAGWHQSIGRYDSDAEKYSEAAILGWCVVRVTAKMVGDGRAADLIERALRGRMQCGTG